MMRRSQRDGDDQTSRAQYRVYAADLMRTIVSASVGQGAGARRGSPEHKTNKRASPGAWANDRDPGPEISTRSKMPAAVPAVGRLVNKRLALFGNRLAASFRAPLQGLWIPS